MVRFVRISVWRNKSALNQVLAAAFTVGTLTLIVELAGVGRDLTIAAEFGTSDALDAFFIALLPTTLMLNVVVGSIAAALTPSFIRVREACGEDAARDLAANAMTLATMLLLSVVIGLRSEEHTSELQ